GPTHPEGQSTIGSAANVKALSREDIVGFHRGALRPDLATFVIVGDVSLGEMRARLETAFAGNWPVSMAAEAVSPAIVPPPRSRSVLVVDRPGAAQSAIRIVTLGPARSSPDLPALDVLNMVLGGSSTSRIERNLRAKHGFAYEARSFFEFRDGASPFIVAANVETKATAPAIREILNELAAIRGTISAAEVGSAASILLRGVPERFLTVRSIAGGVTDLALAGRPLDYTTTHLRRIAEARPPDVMRAARTYIDPARVVVVIVGDWRALEAEIRRLALGPIRVLRPEELIPPPP
ncbi:MAG: insulinase family protein, partial [Gemmatimonadales bacterium]|nr:insulinase family protein [Gemmatimonadales bacterium]